MAEPSRPDRALGSGTPSSASRPIRTEPSLEAVLDAAGAFFGRIGFGAAATGSIGRRLSLAVMFLSALLIALMLLGGRVILQRSLTQEALRGDRELARVVSTELAPVLSSESRGRVWPVLSRLFARRDILFAAVILPDGRILSRLGEPPFRFLPPGREAALERRGDFVMLRETVRRGSDAPVASLELGFSIADARRAAERSAGLLLLAGLALFAAAVVAARMLARRVTEPLAALAQQVRSLGEMGPAAVPAPDELNGVAGAVHELSSRLEETRRSIEQRNHELEETVAERTRELRRTNRALALQNQQALEVSRLKSDFLATMSHELRTPLNAILALSEMLRDEVTGPLANEEQKRQVEMIHASGQGLLRLINNVLDLSRAEAGKIDLHYVRTDLEMLLRSASEPLIPLARAKGLDLRLNLQRGPLLWVDPDRVQQVFVNLLGNAIKFTERGSVEVTSRIEPEEERLTVAVTDTGGGIAPQDHEKIFQEFRQLDPAATRRHGGTGLGLAICRRLVELMGGEISLKSDLGQGATFTFWVSARRENGAAPGPPAGLARPAEAPRAVPPAREAVRGPRSRVVPRVLVVDDDPVAIEALERGCGREGLEVHSVRSAWEALERVEQIRPDLIVLDLMMPGMSGLELVDRLADAPGAGRVPILVNTAKDLSREEWELLEGRVDRIFRKADGGVRALMEEIHRLLDELQSAVDSRSVPLVIDSRTGPPPDRDAA